MTLKLTAAVAQSLATALATAVGSGASIEIRTGTKPATPETAASGTLLCTVPISGAFTAASGSITSADPASATPVAAGTAGYFRLKTSGGTAIIDGDITATGGGGDMQLATTALTTGTPVDLGVPTFTIPVA